MRVSRAAVVAGFIAMLSVNCSKAPAWEALPLGTSADFRDIWFTDADHGWIAGGGFDITGGLIGRTTDAGKTWRFTSNLTTRERMSAQALHVFDSGRVIVAAGNGAILSTTDNGDNWTSAVRRGDVSSLSTLFFLDQRHGWAAGHGDVLVTDDAGETWTPLTPEGVDTSYRPQIRAIYFRDEHRGWAAGMTASLTRTADGGITWEKASTPLAAGEHPDFWDMFFIDEQTGWVVGEEGTILATLDGGDTWTRQSTGLKGDFTITAVRFLTASRGWITGFHPGLGRSLILKTEDAGATWVMDADIAGEELYTLFIRDREQLWAIGARVRPGPQSIYRRALTK
jgi:photosystem II stability/assembly factor-like uncharacterized protein